MLVTELWVRELCIKDIFWKQTEADFHFYRYFFVKWDSHDSTIYILVDLTWLISRNFINMITKIFLNTCKTSELKFILKKEIIWKRHFIILELSSMGCGISQSCWLLLKMKLLCLNHRFILSLYVPCIFKQSCSGRPKGLWKLNSRSEITLWK